MTLLNASARSIAIVLWLWAVFALTACGQSSTRPDSAPMPPRVECEKSPRAQLPPLPELAQMDEWALQVMGIFEAEAAKDEAQRACLAKLRADGVIR